MRQELNQKYTPKLEWIEADDDGLDPTWLDLPDTIKWQRIQAVQEFAWSFPNALGITYPSKMDKTEGVFVGLPRSQQNVRHD
jgi:hypothetical protein